MTSDEMTTGSLNNSEHERRWMAARTRWWNSTGGGSRTDPKKGVNASTKGIGAVKAGDCGVKFRAEWPELDEENWEWMTKNRIDPATGNLLPDPEGEQMKDCSPEVAALRRGPNGIGSGIGAMRDGGQAARDAGQSFLRRHYLALGVALLFGFVAMKRVWGDATD